MLEVRPEKDTGEQVKGYLQCLLSRGGEQALSQMRRVTQWQERCQGESILNNEKEKDMEMNDEEIHEQLVKKIQELIPKCLDDIIRQHREVAQLRFTTDEEIMALYHPIKPGPIKNIFNDWRFITLNNQITQHGQVLLVGTIETGVSRVTSVVRKVDLDRNLVFTNSGSLYQLGTPGHGEPPFEHLATICWAFHSWGFGKALGVPEFFY